MSFLDPSPAVEIAHVLFLDIVGYSRRSLPEQRRLIEDLTRIVLTAPEFARADAAGELVTLPTGDGLAIAFFRYAHSPAQCAIEIARTLPPGLPLRMGIHSGPVTRLIDAQGKENLAGNGVNLAQRVMDCGDAGHILVSAPVATILGQFDAWRDAFQELGPFTVKHGEVVHLYNLCRDGAGNPGLPGRLCAVVSSSPLTVHPVAAVAADRLVVLLYERNAPQTAHLLALLQQALQAAGYDVFMDQHLAVDVEWAHELRRRISAAYAVIPLLSAETIWSEMIGGEVVTAHEAAQQQGGLPRLIPIRIAYEGPLPEPLHAILGARRSLLWRNPQEDALLAESLLRSLREEPTSPLPPEAVGRALPLDSRFYILRPADARFAAAFDRHDSFVLVKGGQQTGKTSLLTQGLQQARSIGARCLHTDFRKLPARTLSQEEPFYLALAEMIADQLNLDADPAESWKPARTPAANFERFLRREALTKPSAPLIWALDEVDRLFHCPFGADVFALFRSWHNHRVLEPTGPWGKLTLAMAYSIEEHLFVTDLNQSPFNVGVRLILSDFTLEEVGELNRSYSSPRIELRWSGRRLDHGEKNPYYGSPLRSDAELERFHRLVGGQPSLCRRGLDLMVQQRFSLADLEAEADLDAGPFGGHLRRLLMMLSQDGPTLEAVRGFLRGEPLPSTALFHRLRSEGLLRGDAEQAARFRCRLYDSYLRRHLGTGVKR